MKRDEIKALIPDIAKETLDSIMEINGKDIEAAKAAKDKEIATLTTERDSLQTRLTTAEETLAKFGDKTPEQIQDEIQTYQKQAKDAKDDLAAQLTQRDQQDWIKAQLDDYGVSSPLARKQIIAEVMAADGGLTWKPEKGGKPAEFIGFGDYMKAAKEEDPTLYQTAEEKAAAEKEAAAQQKKPSFTTPAGNGGGKEKAFEPPVIF